MSRFIRVKTGEPTEWNPRSEYRYINLDAIVEVAEHPEDASRCFVRYSAIEWSQLVIMPAEALVLIIEKKGGQP